MAYLGRPEKKPWIDVVRCGIGGMVSRDPREGEQGN